MREIRNKRLERRDLKTTEFVDLSGKPVVSATTGITETVQEERCPNCGKFYETRGILGPLFMRLGETCDERHRGKEPKGTPFPEDDPRMQDLNDDSPQDEGDV